MEKASANREKQIERFVHLIERQSGKAVRPYRTDGYVNMLNKYGTSKDVSEHYQFQADPIVPDSTVTEFYETGGLFSKIIDAPAEEAVKHGFTLKGVEDEKINSFYEEALDELDWEETAITAIKWTRLYGGAIAVLLVNDGRGLEEPIDWKNIQSIDDIRVYDRCCIQPDYDSMYSYDPQDPFGVRGSRLGMPERYTVQTQYSNFTVHDSRCLVFRNGVLPENASNMLYQVWGVPEYVRVNRAVRNTELAHETAPKLLDRSIQAIYKMKDLAAELATEEGEDKVLRRLETIDMARGMLNSITIDSEGEDYDFKSFSFAGVNDVISASCNMLSAVTNIPQVILFGIGVGGLSTADNTAMENYYNYVERIQRRMLRSNLRYLLSIIFQAGLYTGEIDEIPKINVEFNPLWSMNDVDKASLDLQKAQLQQMKAQTAIAYIQADVIDPLEVRKTLAESDEFDVDTMLDEYDDEELFENAPSEQEEPQGMGMSPDMMGMGGMMPSTEGVPQEDVAENSENAPQAAPTATKLPQDMSDEELKKSVQRGDSMDGNNRNSRGCNSVGVIVVKDGKVLCGKRHNTSDYGLLCGPGGHIDFGEDAERAAIRETKEEFGITPNELICLGYGEIEKTGNAPMIYMCTDYTGSPVCNDLEIVNPKFMSLNELLSGEYDLFEPFENSLDMLSNVLADNDVNKEEDYEGEFPETSVEVENEQFGGTDKSEKRESLLKKFLDKFTYRLRALRSDASYNNSKGQWITLKGGAHVFVENGQVTKGPKELVGMGTEGFYKNQGVDPYKGLTPPRKFKGQKLRAHFKNHANEFGYQTEHEYLNRGKRLMSKRIGGDIDGYLSKNGDVVRFNKATGEYVKGVPGGVFKTYFIPKFNDKKGTVNLEAAREYFEKDKKKYSV